MGGFSIAMLNYQRVSSKVSGFQLKKSGGATIGHQLLFLGSVETAAVTAIPVLMIKSCNHINST